MGEPGSFDRFLSRVDALVAERRDPSRAVAMAAYMRNQFPFAGIAGPGQKLILREATGGLAHPGREELLAAGEALWSRDEREYQYLAIALLARHARRLTASDLPRVEHFIRAKSWWDTVDALASHVVGALVAAQPEVACAMDLWIEDEDFWLARAAILHQLRYKERTDSSRLFRYCLRRSGDREFFIRKAIGWALREYSKTDAGAVRGFVADNEGKLSPLSSREALLWLNGGRGAKPRED